MIVSAYMGALQSSNTGLPGALGPSLGVQAIRKSALTKAARVAIDPRLGRHNQAILSRPAAVAKRPAFQPSGPTAPSAPAPSTFGRNRVVPLPAAAPPPPAADAPPVFYASPEPSSSASSAAFDVASSGGADDAVPVRDASVSASVSIPDGAMYAAMALGLAIGGYLLWSRRKGGR